MNQAARTRAQRYCIACATPEDPAGGGTCMNCGNENLVAMPPTRREIEEQYLRAQRGDPEQRADRPRDRSNDRSKDRSNDRAPAASTPASATKPPPATRTDGAPLPAVHAAPRVDASRSDGSRVDGSRLDAPTPARPASLPTMGGAAVTMPAAAPRVPERSFTPAPSFQRPPERQASAHEGPSSLSTRDHVPVPYMEPEPRVEPEQLVLKPTKVEYTRHGWMSGASAGTSTVDDLGGSHINELLGGTMRGALILLVGKAGHGKSTAAAGLVAAACAYWSNPRPPPGVEKHDWRKLRQAECDFFWLDSDQGDPGLVRTLFINADAEDLFEERANLLEPPPIGGRPLTFEEAVGRVPRTARVLVIDSLEKWGGQSPKKQIEIMERVRAHPAWLKIVINGANKDGESTGREEITRADDATVHAKYDPGSDEYSLSFDKCRWQPCASWKARKGVTKRAMRLVTSQSATSVAPSSSSTDTEPAEVPPAAADTHAARSPALRLVGGTDLDRAGGEAPARGARAEQPEPPPPPSPPPVASAASSAPIAPAPLALPPSSIVVPATDIIPMLGEFTPMTCEPDYEERFVARVAATWSTAQRNAYRARLKRNGCDAEGLRAWNEQLEDVLRGKARPRCKGRPGGAWCGEIATLVAEAEGGMRWYACGLNCAVGAKTTTPVAQAPRIRMPLGEFGPKD